MMARKKADAATHAVEPHDPYRLRSLEQILSLFDGGEFLTEVMTGHRDL
jgi:hypothetical protein